MLGFDALNVKLLILATEKAATVIRESVNGGVMPKR